MKTFLIVGAVLLIAVLGFTRIRAYSQPKSPSRAATQSYGRGRGGAPFAWNDRNGDGICDLTGQPVGQGRPMGFQRGGWGWRRRGFARQGK